MTMTARYSDHLSSHTDYYYCGDVNLWRDVFTADQLQKLIGKERGATVDLEYDLILEEYDDKKRVKIKRDQFQPPKILDTQVEPRVGRWYPQGCLKGIASVYPQSLVPLRVVDTEEASIVVDLNHPLAGRKLSLQLSVENIEVEKKERGGRCNDWVENVLADGPGMQLQYRDSKTDFSEPRAMERQIDGDDSLFYRVPRLVNHIDSQAQNHLSQYLRSTLPEEGDLLDLMASVHSYLPEGRKAVGLGMNEAELKANRNLSQYCVQDLNQYPVLPFAAGRFRAVFCHLSIEYLLQPRKIVEECARVLKGNGILVVSFSNRWFPEKVTRIWKTLHDFERVAYVMQLLAHSFADLKGVSYRNWPRPFGDPHMLELQTSDPLFIVTATRR